MDRGIDDPLVVTIDRLTPHHAGPLDLVDPRRDQEFVAGCGRGPEPHIGFDHDYLIAGPVQRVDAAIECAEGGDACVLQIRRVHGVIDVVVGVEFAPADLDRGSVHTAETRRAPIPLGGLQNPEHLVDVVADRGVSIDRTELLPGSAGAVASGPLQGGRHRVAVVDWMALGAVEVVGPVRGWTCLETVGVADGAGIANGCGERVARRGRAVAPFDPNRCYPSVDFESAPIGKRLGMGEGIGLIEVESGWQVGDSGDG